jgi:hypothetical protein
VVSTLPLHVQVAALAAVVMCLQVKPDSSVAQRSAASGHLVLTMPKEEPDRAAVDVTYLRQANNCQTGVARYKV